jgi:ATP-dependent helicase/nuclease subunit A
MEYFAKEKRDENAVDYSDLEHFTLKLLKNEEIKNEIASRYSYIFTDEYQDTSGVQEAILTAIARDNLFMVGDLKQSIYDFRGCNPDIFAKKYVEYSNGNGGVAINLDKNFRSTRAVLNSVNSLFSDIMTMRCGSVDYKSTPMEVGADYPENEGEAVMCLAKKYKGEKQLPEGVYTVVGHLNVLKDSKCFAEGRAVAELVENLVGTQYYDIKSGKLKSVDYGDIAILLRDANKDADKFSTELIRAGIPLSAPSKDSIGNYSEVALAINILQLIDCYNQDIPLASVLKSEIGKVSDSELLQIRKYTPKGSFVEAVKAYADSNQDELAQKLIQFEEFFNSIRMLAEFLPCGEILAEVVRSKGLDIKILSSRLGEIKLARLNKFIEVADASKQTVG